MTRCSLSLTEGLREMIASGRLTEAMIPDDFQWLEAALGFAEQPSPPAPFVITEGSLKKNVNDSPVTPRPPAPRSQVASLDRSIDDLLGEALRRHRHGLIRPLWAEMPEGLRKQAWRDSGRALLRLLNLVEQPTSDDRALCLRDERDQAQGLLREAAAGALSTKTALAVIREAWRAGAARAEAVATVDPQTPEQWRAFGVGEATRACADELDPEKADRFEPSELAKARGEVEWLTRQIAALVEALRPLAVEADMWGDAVPDGHKPTYVEMGHWDARYYGSASAFSVGDLRAAAAAIAQLDAPPSRRVRHKKRGTTYTVIGEDFRLQSSRSIEEGETLAVYRGDDGKGWARPLDEFTDGRFEPAEPRS